MLWPNEFYISIQHYSTLLNKIGWTRFNVHINIVYDCEDTDLFFLDVKGKVGNKFSLQQVKLQTFTGKENQFFSNYFVRNKLVWQH